jgi:sarcosine oxidase subunit gamma
MCSNIALVSTWVSGVNALEMTLGNALDTAVPQHCGGTQQCEQGLLMRTGPQEFLLVGKPFRSDVAGSLRKDIPAAVGSVIDLSHARCRVRVEGVQCKAVLNKLFALNLLDLEFPVGEVRLSGHHHVPATLHRLGPEVFDLYVFSTYAHDQLGVLLDAALEYGVVLHSVRIYLMVLKAPSETWARFEAWIGWFLNRIRFARWFALHSS